MLSLCEILTQELLGVLTTLMPRLYRPDQHFSFPIRVSLIKGVG
jgi:hypothetical protein